MARRWFEKVKSKVRKRQPAAPHQSALAPSPPTPSPTPTNHSTDISANAFSTDLDGFRHLTAADSTKATLEPGLRRAQSERAIVDKAVHAAPEAAVAWVGVCLGLEILSNPVTEARDNRKGIAYVLSRMEWYWNLVSLLLLLDENKAGQSSAGLRLQLEKHVVQLYEKLKRPARD